MAKKMVKVEPEQPTPEEQAKEQSTNIDKMVDDRDKKMANAFSQLEADLQVLSEKCLTANGVQEAMDAIRTVIGNDNCMKIGPLMEMACDIAKATSKTCLAMKGKLGHLSYEKLDQLCDGFYDAHFANKKHSIHDMAFEIMRLRLCHNVGPCADDAKQFFVRANEEIDKANDALVEFCKENDIDMKTLLPDKVGEE